MGAIVRPPLNHTAIIQRKEATRFSRIREKEVIITSEFTYVELKAARESHGNMPRWKLAGAIGVSESTIERWEIGKQKPEPDDVNNIAKALGMMEIWHKWMLSHYDSYRERYTDVPRNDSLAETLMRTKYEAMDVVNVLNEVERDTLSGNFKSSEQRKKLRKETQEAMAALQQMLDRTSDDD